MIICVAGKHALAVESLKYLVKEFPEFNYCVVPSDTDDGCTSWQPSLKYESHKLGIPSIKLEEVYPLDKLIFFSFQFDRILKPGLFSSNMLFNIHYSLLPFYKGMYPAVHPILNGEEQTGVTLHKIDHGIDTGDIIDQKIVKIDHCDTSQDLYLKLTEAGVQLFKENARKLLLNKFVASSQPNRLGSYYSVNSLNFSNLCIDFNKTAIEVHNQFRAFSFRQYQLPTFNGRRIYKTSVTNERSVQKPGSIITDDSVKTVISSVDYNLELYKDYYDELWLACINGSLSQVKTYASRVYDINLRNNRGWSAIILAVFHGHKEIVQHLISLGADVNCTNYRGTTLPMYALTYFKNSGDPSMLHLLGAYELDIKLEDESGKSIFDYCDETQAVLLQKAFKS